MGLGSNLGRPVHTIFEAARRMDGLLPGVRLAACSSVHHTAPLGPADQPWYANAAAALDVSPHVTPQALFDALCALEADLGRNRVFERRFGPRPADIDLLLFGRTRLASQRLTLPHPRLAERAFVLVPLAEIAPDLILPGGLGVHEALGRLSFVRGRSIIIQS